MSSKTVLLPGVGEITLVKRAQSRTIRLSVTGSGVKVSLPKWTAFAAAEAFAAQHVPWIQQELVKQQRPSLQNGQRIGKLHYLRFEHVLGGQTITSRVTGTEIVVKMQLGESVGDTSVQKRATPACIRALKREAERLLPPRLQTAAERAGLQYKSVSIKSLKRRWGSCDSQRNIVLNLYLMELPWEYIDYVLLHELTHTVHMDHSSAFWGLLTSLQPAAQQLGKRLRRHQPSIGSWQP